MSRPSSTNLTRLEVTTNQTNTSVYQSKTDIFDQCNYKLLFSHLPLSISFIHQIDLGDFNFQSFNFPNSKALNVESADIQYQQHLTYKLIISIALLLFGLFFATIGYRFLKLSTFICGFSLGSSIIYLILMEQKQLTLIENLIISLSIGVLFAFVALLVQYIGLFILGIMGSIAVSTCILIFIDLFYGNKSAWMCILLLFVCATIQASLSLKFQRSMTILNTSSIGSLLLVVSLDFFVENNLLIDYILELYRVNGNAFNMFERQKALLKPGQEYLKMANRALATTKMPATTTTKLNSTSSDFAQTSGALGLVLKLYSSAHDRLCWYTWTIFGSFFIMLLFSLLIQLLITARSYDHRESWHKYKGIPTYEPRIVIRGSRKKRSANLEKIRLKSHIENAGHQKHGPNYNTSSRSTDSDIGIGGHNDTFLLVESGRHSNENYDTNQHLNYSVGSSESPRPRRKRNKSRDTDNIEIISFEVMKSPKKESKKQKASRKNPLTTSTSTTTSTTSSASTSSTCQLIPLKLNSDVNSQTTATSTISASPRPAPSAPPLVSSQNSSPLPPPVPNQPPPKLPSSLASQTSIPQLMHNKINQHRNSSSRERDKDKDKSSSDEKFRHLYQMRRNNGDVLSQDFINNIQTKLSSSSNLNDTALVNTSSSLSSNKSKTKSGTPSKKK
ncbi:DNA excision repair haywire [Brachionus plicatilis]|uniref:Transmembrane protein 198 n=1 Tax=Brachionus plicatilis TaxID=10195 RepID=A0A3M7RWN5_BRAPC|nr:DNA excision repair haywire [Brachionus plicatilis]